MDRNKAEQLADHLEQLSSSLAAHPRLVIGQMGVAIGQMGAAGSTIGIQGIAVGRAGHHGNVYGNVGIADGGQAGVAEVKLIQELLDAAKMVREGKAPKSWVAGLLDRVRSLSGKALDASVIAAATELAESALS